MSSRRFERYGKALGRFLWGFQEFMNIPEMTLEKSVNRNIIKRLPVALVRFRKTPEKNSADLFPLNFRLFNGRAQRSPTGTTLIELRGLPSMMRSV
jgi:hypothetical protein